MYTYTRAHTHTFYCVHMCSLTKNVFSYYRMCSLTIECSIVFSFYCVHAISITRLPWKEKQIKAGTQKTRHRIKTRHKSLLLC